MNTNNNLLVIAVLAALVAIPAATASAQDTGTADFTVHDRERGELSPGARAPTTADLMSAIDSASPSALASLLEYGERVECMACIPLLEARVLEDGNAQTREMAAWWLRRRPFGFADVYHRIRAVLETDASAVRRARAAEALGEFMVPNGVVHLGRALQRDTDVSVRAAAVRGLIRINVPTALPYLSEALRSGDTQLQRAVLDGVLHVNFFRDVEGIIDLLAADDAGVRRQAALVLGALDGAEAAVPALAAILRGDSDVMARQGAAWALGRIGGTAARTALTESQGAESSRRVLDAIEVALRMR